MKTNFAPIGIFDSGLGGLSVLRELVRLLPNERFVYLADQARVPYGSRKLNELRIISQQAVEFLMGLDSKLIVIACNTASAAALRPLREQFLGFPFVGMEPALKPAVTQSKGKKVGVLATPATFQGELFANLLEKYTEQAQIYSQACPGWVELVEDGLADSPTAEQKVREVVEPLLREGVDTLVLGCTHYPFLLSTLRKVVSPETLVIDPSPAVAQQTVRRLDALGLRVQEDYTLPDATAQVVFFTTGRLARYREQLHQVWDLPISDRLIFSLHPQDA
ncbi:MAG TPA: glutamate racemase [Anaerolineales bacterium]|nr:glutamate racemase [Anaerolineales bacterium]